MIRGWGQRSGVGIRSQKYNSLGVYVNSTIYDKLLDIVAHFGENEQSIMCVAS